MMYIKRTPTDNTTQGSTPDPTQGASDPTASSPNNAAQGGNESWYNIQDYLKANTGQGGNDKLIDNRVKGKANDAVQQQSVYNQNSQNTSIPDPTSYTPGAFNAALGTAESSNGVTNPLTENLNQNFNNLDTTVKKADNPFANTNNSQDLSRWFGQNVGGAYNQGQQNTDSLLFNSSGKSKDIISSANQDYANNVENPYQQQLATKTAEVTDKQGKYDTANKDWHTNLTDWLASKNAAIDAEAATEAASGSAPAANHSIADMVTAMGGTPEQQAALTRALSGQPSTSQRGGWNGGQQENNDSVGSDTWIANTYGQDFLNSIKALRTNTGNFWDTKGTTAPNRENAKATLGYTPGSKGIYDMNAVEQALGVPSTTIGSSAPAFSTTSNFNRDKAKASLAALFGTRMGRGMAGNGRFSQYAGNGESDENLINSLLGL